MAWNLKIDESPRVKCYVNDIAVSAEMKHAGCGSAKRSGKAV